MSTKSYKEILGKGHRMLYLIRGFLIISDESEKEELGKNVTYMNFSRHDILVNQKMPSDHAVYIIKWT